MGTAIQTLDQLASEANARLDRAKVAEDKAGNLRVSAGEILAEAKDRVRAGEPGHTNWAKWVRDNVNHSYSYVNKCVAIGHAPDPPTEARRQSEMAHAKSGSTVEPVQRGDVERPPVDPAAGMEPVARVWSFMVSLGVTIEQLVAYGEEA